MARPIGPCPVSDLWLGIRTYNFRLKNRLRLCVHDRTVHQLVFLGAYPTAASPVIFGGPGRPNSWRAGVPTRTSASSHDRLGRDRSTMGALLPTSAGGCHWSIAARSVVIYRGKATFGGVIANVAASSHFRGEPNIANGRQFDQIQRSITGAGSACDKDRRRYNKIGTGHN